MRDAPPARFDSPPRAVAGRRRDEEGSLIDLRALSRGAAVILAVLPPFRYGWLMIRSRWADGSATSYIRLGVFGSSRRCIARRSPSPLLAH